MRRIMTLLLCACVGAAMTGCAASADQHAGEAQGYGGLLRVTVSISGEDITSVTVTEHSETQGVGTRAIDALPGAIAEADSVEVDDISGATVTSTAIKQAVRTALGWTADMTDAPDSAMPQTTAAPLLGVGMAATGRVTEGEDGSSGHSVSVVFAFGSFDDEGRILSLSVDEMEGVLPAMDELTEEDFRSAVSAWTTKGAQGDAYMMPSGSWRQQMDAYADMMKGMTVDEVNDWFGKYFSADTGRPLTEGDAFDALTEEERKVLSDVTSRASMSLRSSESDILLAIRRAWEDAQRRSNGSGVITDTNTQTDATDGGSTMG